MWSQQHTIAWVIIATTAFGFLFYSLTVMAALVSPACPFQTPISTILCMMRIDRILRPMVKSVSQNVRKSITFVHDAVHRLLGTLKSGWTEFYEDPALAVRSFAWCCLQPLLSALHRIAHWLRSLVLRTSTSVVDPEAQSPDQNPYAVATDQGPVKLELPDTPISSLEAPSIKWLLETSTDPEVFLAAASLVPHVEWPLDLDVSDMLQQLYDVYMSCLDVQRRIVPSLEEKASACTMALCHLYCGRILQGLPAYGFNGYGSFDYYVFRGMLGRTKVTNDVLVATTKLFGAKYRSWSPSLPNFGACPDSVLEWLSHTLSFHFVIGKVDKVIEELAVTVISKLLCSSSSPSPQIIANCTLLACVMVGVQFDKKDIARVDKSSALPQLARSLWAQFQKVLWASGEGDLDSAVRRAWHFDIICQMLDLDLPDLRPPAGMWNLGVCWKIYSRARSSEQNDRDSSAPMLTAQRFRFAVDVSRYNPSLSPAWLWRHRISWQGHPHSPEDFGWLVDYLGDVCSNDHATAGDILLLLSGMSVSCSPAKQHLYIEKLVACMGSSMPSRLRHAALRAAHSFREVLASINIVDDADIALTNFSPAVLTAVCPQPGATPTDTGPDCFFDGARELCYLELIFALARNSQWRPHLYSHVDRAIEIIEVCCGSRWIHAFYLVGIFLRMTSEEVLVTSLSTITKRQWWDMMGKAWNPAVLTADNTHCVEFLPVLVEGTKKYMHIASMPELIQLISDVDDLIRSVERQGLLEHRERATVAMKELSGVANDMLANFSK
ncbi:hypothetical protein P692DRAFT_20883401 [Suillus brevipes Sb2]|nr:hypothetical protein P692DRAFT_20883401 [Suillus brevipes Sb2]